MSIRDEIQRHLGSELVRLKPSMRSIRVVRSVIVSAEIASLVDGPWPDRQAEEAFSRLKSDLDGFIAGDVATVAKTPRRAKSAFLSRLEKERGQIWELRQRKPNPGMRILGGFSEKDVLIGLSWYPRIQLQGYGSREWRDAIEECKACWRRLFLSWPPFGCEKAKPHEYISNLLLV